MPTYDVEVLLADNTTWLGLMLVKPEDWQPGSPVRLEDHLAPLVSTAQFENELAVRIQEDWSRGVGLDYDGAYGVYTRTRGMACPAGAPFTVTIAAGNNSSSPIVAFAELDHNADGVTDLWVAQRGTASANTARVMRSPGGTGSGGGALVDSLNLGANEYIRDLLVADDGAGITRLFASSSDVNGLNGRMHRLNADGTWTSTAAATFGTNGRNRMAAVHWTTADGNSAWRIVCITGPKTFAYTLPGADPLLAASWVEGVGGAGAGSLGEVGTTGSLTELVGFRNHIFLAATDDLYDVNEMGESRSITSYLRRMLQPGNGTAVEHLNGYIYMAVGRGLIRTYVGDNGVLDESPLEGQCAPGWNTPAEGEFRGYVTALCVDQGYLVAAVYNPKTAKTFIFWGIDRRVVGVDTPQPLVWYGPEVFIDTDYRVDRMWTSGLVANELRLWISSTKVGTGAPDLTFIQIPVAGTPVQDLVSNGSMRFCTELPGVQVIQPWCRIESLTDSWDDKAIKKIAYEFDIGTRGTLGANATRVAFDFRVDPIPAPTASPNPAWTAVGDADGTTNADGTSGAVVKKLFAASGTTGYKFQHRLRFFAPSALANPPVIPILDSVRQLAWRVPPSARRVTLPVEYGDGVTNGDGGEDTDRSPITKTSSLIALTSAYPVTSNLRDRRGRLWTVKWLQALDGDELATAGTFGLRVRKTLTGIVLAGPN